MNGLESTAGLPDLAALAATESLRSPPVQGDVAGKAASTQSLRELTKAICRGDEPAFTRFYDLYSLRIYKHLLVMARGGEREAREGWQAVVGELARQCKGFLHQPGV